MNLRYSEVRWGARNRTGVSHPVFSFAFEEPKYEEFYTRFIMGNSPCILSCGMIDDWKASKSWVDSSGDPDLQDLGLEYDWLNEFWEEQPELRDDFRFVYVGVAGTWTPFHADVFRSFSWSANVCGRKRWILLPPGEEEKLRSLSQLPFDVAGVLGAESPSAAVSSATLPAGVSVARLQPKTSPGGVRYFDVIQEAGEVMFVPSDWHHQVWNLRDTISINHNWLNAANVGHASRHLLASLTAVKAELADIADGSGAWLAQCQQLLKATHGMDVREFVELLCFAADRRLDGARGAAAVRGLDGWQHSRDHLRWDLARVRCVLRRLLALEDVTRAPDMDECLARAQRVIADIEEVCPPEAGGAPGPGQCDCGVCA
ncbi:2-oxoglutarate and iron-dependent oxygenase JMJD4-like isoform X3 [Pollicipes pollicipes]|uniref:2-oxoglutarate and iron-dependent oxygenase JMJD4-like isoform X3 n=1 Tax=Pollicipes pollicipes TaxID=41117 RepID=UPI001885A070|nr:2-oxoglutarate and iron-dependent oxygenase JMJD4-like isoform X3 [Pollicipes pollicipes]XP_037069348.1 2-oxoglutarate and iron-dependent oxygenase JMJD4-like isoform X3 [Pollicipes pollicipes]